MDTVSSLVRHLASVLPSTDSIPVGDFLPLLGVHGFAFFILVLGVLNVAIFMLPGLSIMFGIPMIIMAAQMLTGHKSPIFPEYVRKQKISVEYLRQGLGFTERALSRAEKVVRPRLHLLTHPVMHRFNTIVTLLLSLMVAIPIPFLNIPPTIGIVLLMMGVMQRDGYFVVLAYFFGIWSFWLYESLGNAAHSLIS